MQYGRTPGFRLRQGRLVAAAMVVALCGTVASACGGGGGSSSPAKVTVEPFEPANFGPPGTGPNKWIPFRFGYQTVREGGVNRGHRRLTHRRVYTVTDVAKEINGVRAVAVLDQDFDSGELAEQAIDWLVEDKSANVWNLGAYTESYEGGQFVNFTDAWLAGVKGGGPGILIKGDLRKGMAPWSQAKIPGHEASTAALVATDQSTCVPFKCYSGAVVVREGPSETKHYVEGVGSVRTDPNTSAGEGESELLINITQLSPTGLSEISGEVLRLEEHARAVAKDVYGGTRPATRLS
jgi:hypothetical protein